ncbi:MAG: hypothetical protein IJU21_06730 [Bacteroidales bacterium]|nr:hypothetical protein [Bacteroidales bacterium]
MTRTLHRLFLAALSLIASSSALIAQDKVLLIKAESAQLLEIDGDSYRKVTGPAKFLHNDTYLLCDTAYWNINTNIIDAMGHVRIIQDRTTLSSNTLQYVVDQDLARFRGDLVQLVDQDKNTLRTKYLDYNTKDSVAVFQDGGAMRDKDGQVIESLYGTYDSKAKLFVFNDQVNMYMDTTFIKTSRLEYRSDLSTAWFGYGTDMWQDDKMLSADDGWYNRKDELYMFRKNVHTLTKEKETWSDSAYYYRAVNDVELLGKVEVMDTVQNMYILAGYLQWTDSLERATLTRDPAIMSVIEEEGQLPDSLYLGADTLVYRAYKKYEIPEAWVKDSEKRLKDISGDAIMEYRRKAAEAAAKAAADAMKDDPNRAGAAAAKAKKGPGGPAQPKQPGAAPTPPAPVVPETPDQVGGDEPVMADPDRPSPVDSLPPMADSITVPGDTLAALGMTEPADTLAAPVDTLAIPADTIAVPVDTLGVPETLVPETPDQVGGDDVLPPADSLSAPADTLMGPLDSTKVGFIWGSRDVKLFRRNMQMRGDSLAYSDLDSLARVYRDPIFFTDGNRQYAADSIYLVIRNKRTEKAHLLSNAFITIQEDPNSYDQVSGTEMVAYFDSSQVLTRFDALGGASSIFFLEENGALATVNKVDSKMLYATFTDGEIDHMYYYDNPKNDGYPSVQLPSEERKLKGYRWEPEKRPDSPAAVTSLKPRKSQRTSYLARPHTTFTQTEIYFPGYIKKVYRDIAIRDSLEVVRKQAQQRLRDSLNLAVPPDSLDVPADSLAIQAADSLAASVPDSLKTASALPDSLSSARGADSLAVEEPHIPTPAEIKAAEKARKAEEKARKKEEKQKALEAKWAEEDRIYEEKQAAKAARKLERERDRKLKMLRRLEKKSIREQKRLEKYIARERAKAQRKKNKTKS